MRIEFVQRENPPLHHAADACLVFDEQDPQPLIGMKLTGFSIWVSYSGEVSVGLPWRNGHAPGDPIHLECLVSQNGPRNTVAFKAWVLEQYRKAGSPGFRRAQTKGDDQ